MKKVIFINPPFLSKYSRESRSPAVAKSGTLYYPMWLAYAAGFCEKKGIAVDLVDYPVSEVSSEELTKRILEQNPLMCVFNTSTPAIDSEAVFVKEIKEKYMQSGKTVFCIMVGPHVSALKEKIIEQFSWVDAVCYGEYDETVYEVAVAVAEGQSIKSVKGLVYIDNGSVVDTGKRPYIEDLQQFPFVSYVYKKFLNHKNYFYSHSRYPIVTIVTSRGCPYQCTYCVLPQTVMGHGLRKREVEDVVREFEYIKENFPDIKEIMIEDDTITVDKARIKKFCALLIEKKINIPWSANSRADVDYETLRSMKDAGCRLLCVGFESGNQVVLDNIKKNIRVEQFAKFREAAKKAGVMIHGCFLVGNKGETKETLEETLTLAKKLNTDTAQFFPIMVYPGTSAYKWAEENRFLVSGEFSQWLNSQGLHNCVVSTNSLSSKELVDFCDRARKEFYLRPSYILYKLVQSIKNPHEGARNLKSFKIFFRHLRIGKKEDY